MNNANFYGRITRDLTVNGEGDKMVAKTVLAVDRMKKIEGHPDADFIPLVFFGARAKAAAQYLKKGYRFSCSTHVQTGFYTKKDTQEKVYTTEFIVDAMDFVEKKQSTTTEQPNPSAMPASTSVPNASQPAMTASASVPNASQPATTVQQPPVPPNTFAPSDMFSGFPDINDMELPWNQNQ